MFRPYWAACYAIEKPYYIDYQGTDLDDRATPTATACATVRTTRTTTTSRTSWS